MLIKYNDDRLCVLSITKQEGVPAIEVDSIKLFPGWNEIAYDQFLNVWPSIKSYVESGRMDLRCKKETDPETGEVKFIDQELQDVRADYARDIVKGCFNPGLLEQWSTNSKLSAELRNLCDIQMAEFEKTKKQ